MVRVVTGQALSKSAWPQGGVAMFGASLGSLDLKDLKLKTGPQHPAYRGWEDLYRQAWTWDKVAWGTHCVDCYPGNCPYRVYVKDGLVWFEEVAGTFPTIEQGVPDKIGRAHV